MVKIEGKEGLFNIPPSYCPPFGDLGIDFSKINSNLYSHKQIEVIDGYVNIFPTGKIEVYKILTDYSPSPDQQSI